MKINGLYRTFFITPLLLAFVSAGCKKPAANAGVPGASSAAPLSEVRLGYFPNLTHAQAVLGVATGDFQKALGDTKLSAKTFNAGPALIQALNSGAIDIGYVGPGPAINDFVASDGAAIRVVSGSAANGVVIVASKGSNIQELKDLKGKSIASPQTNNTQDIAARHYVTTVLGQTDDHNVKAVENSLLSSRMQSGGLDAAWVPEPWGSRLIFETGAHLVGEEKEIWPNHEFALTVIVTTPEFLKNHADVIQKLLTVQREWTRKLQADPTAYAAQLNDDLAALAGKKLPEAVLADALKRVKFTDDPSIDTFKTMEQWSADLNVIKRAPDITPLFATEQFRGADAVSPTTRP